MLAIAICGIYVAILQHSINQLVNQLVQLCIFKLLDKFLPKFLDNVLFLKVWMSKVVRLGVKPNFYWIPTFTSLSWFSAQNAFRSKPSCLKFSDHTHSFLTSNPENTYKFALNHWFDWFELRWKYMVLDKVVHGIKWPLCLNLHNWSWLPERKFERRKFGMNTKDSFKAITSNCHYLPSIEYTGFPYFQRDCLGMSGWA